MRSRARCVPLFGAHDSFLNDRAVIFDGIARCGSQDPEAGVSKNFFTSRIWRGENTPSPRHGYVTMPPRQAARASRKIQLGVKALAGEEGVGNHLARFGFALSVIDALVHSILRAGAKAHDHQCFLTAAFKPVGRASWNQKHVVFV